MKAKTKKKVSKKGPVDPPIPRKARRDALAREKLRQIMEPSDDLLRRLARAGAINSSHVVDDDAPVRKRRAPGTSPRRSRIWQLRCGKCGTPGQYKTAAGICIRCGAITVRD